MNRRDFVVAPIGVVLLGINGRVNASPVAVLLFIAEVLGAVAAGYEIYRAVEEYIEKANEPKCKTRKKYVFDGSTCIHCEACVPYLETNNIDLAVEGCPTQALYVEIEVICQK
jgi:NAD-dependent dihydropyrimidine dehydrogenase PreA subunit